MKISIHLAVLFAASLASAPFGAAAEVQHLQLVERIDPTFPNTLPTLGITRGRVRCVIDVDREGRVEDVLIVAYTHEALARAVRDVMPRWRFQPASVDGRPVGAQTTLDIEMGIVGTVVSMDVTSYVSTRFEEIWGQSLAYREWKLKDLDAVPVPQHTDAPHFPAELAERGITGRVRVEFYIDEKGQVRLPVVTEFDHPELAAFALDAIRQWRFSPPLRAGRPVLVQASQDFRFGGVTSVP